MPQFELICWVLMLVAALDIAARKIRLPYPILMVLSGLALSLIPGLPRVTIAPELVLPIFLPPLLFPAAFLTSWHDFKTNLRPIVLLAVGLVLATMVAVAWVSNTLIHGLSWPGAFVLGAIVSTPDAIAATAVFKSLEVPRRIVTILEGESLANDTVALVAYRMGVVAVVTGSFSAPRAAMELPLVALGGAAIGGLVGLGIDWIQRRLDDPPVQITISLLAPFMAYLPADRLGCSGALAIVTAGVFIGWRLPRMVKARTRLEMAAFWRMLVYLLNGIIFIFIGLQLPRVMEGLGHKSLRRLVFEAAAVSTTAIGVRLLWIFPSAYLPRFLFKKIRERDPYPDWRHLVIIGWAGMRGVDSLATALALPFVTAAGMPFPGRDTIIFISFAVILVTLVAQGLTLPLLIRMLNVTGDGKADCEESVARIKANEAALSFLENLVTKDTEYNDELNLLIAQYQERLGQLRSEEEAGEQAPGESAQEGSPFRRFAHEALQKEYEALIDLRNRHRINDETLRVVQRDVDLAETRLAEMDE
jgi:CPA1 family monovalent cation:H+ antiporter